MSSDYIIICLADIYYFESQSLAPYWATLITHSRWTLSYSDLGCWLPNVNSFQTFTLTYISWLRCSLL